MLWGLMRFRGLRGKVGSNVCGLRDGRERDEGGLRWGRCWLVMLG